MEKVVPLVSFEDPRVREYVLDSVGEEGLRVAELLSQRGNATDTELAEVLSAKPSYVRKILYDLYEARAAEYHKEKDKETGWLTFHWSLTPDTALHALDTRLRRELGVLEEKLKFEQAHDFYACPTGHERFDFNGASEVEFHCPDHGDLLQAQDNASEIEQIRHRIEELEKYQRRLHA